MLQILRRVVHRVERRVIRALERDRERDDVALDEDALGALQDEALSTWRVPRARTLGPVEGVERRRALLEGFSLHAAVAIGAADREGLERLCRYGARPAFAHERLAWTPSGQGSNRLKWPWPDGRTHLELAPVAFLRRR